MRVFSILEIRDNTALSGSHCLKIKLNFLVPPDLQRELGGERIRFTTPRLSEYKIESEEMLVIPTFREET